MNALIYLIVPRSLLHLAGIGIAIIIFIRLMKTFCNIGMKVTLFTPFFLPTATSKLPHSPGSSLPPVLGLVTRTGSSLFMSWVSFICENYSETFLLSASPHLHSVKEIVTFPRKAQYSCKKKKKKVLYWIDWLFCGTTAQGMLKSFR